MSPWDKQESCPCLGKFVLFYILLVSAEQNVLSSFSRFLHQWFGGRYCICQNSFVEVRGRRHGSNVWLLYFNSRSQIPLYDLNHACRLLSSGAREPAGKVKGLEERKPLKCQSSSCGALQTNIKVNDGVLQLAVRWLAFVCEEEAQTPCGSTSGGR